MIDALVELFSRAGLNRTEAVVLELLCKEGTLSPARLAKLTQMKRPTVYAALGNLLQQRLVMKEIKRGGAQYTAVDRNVLPSTLAQQAQQRYDEIRQATSLVEKSLRELPKSPSRKIGSFEIRSLESPKAILKQLEDALLSGDFVAIFNPQSIPLSVTKTTISQFLDKSAAAKPSIREIAVDGPTTEWYVRHIKNKNHLVKRLPRKTDIDSDIILYDGNVVVTNHEPGKEVSLRIREESFYRSMREVFELLWSRLEVAPATKSRRALATKKGPS